METQPFVSIAPWTLIFQIANLLLLMVLFKKYLFKPVTEILEKRKQEIEGHYQEAEDAEHKAIELKTAYEGRMKGAREEAEQIVKSATDNAAQLSENMLRETSEQVERMKKKAADDIQMEKQKAFREAKGELSGIALDIASQILDREVSENDYAAMIEDFIKNVGEA